MRLDRGSSASRSGEELDQQSEGFPLLLIEAAIKEGTMWVCCSWPSRSAQCHRHLTLIYIVMTPI